MVISKDTRYTSYLRAKRFHTGFSQSLSVSSQTKTIQSTASFHKTK